MSNANFQIRRAAEWINFHDGVIAYPTEAVYGLGCHPESEMGLMRILQIKNRDWRKGMLLVASCVEQVIPYITIAGLSQLDCFKEDRGYPITWLLPVESYVSPLLTGTHPKIAIRISNHPIVKALCDTANSPIVSTSANRAGQKPMTQAHQVRAQMGLDIDQIIAASVGSFSRPSAIIDAETQTVLRAY